MGPLASLPPRRIGRICVGSLGWLRCVHRLPVWTPHCAEFKDNHRAISDAIKPLNRLMLDFDEKGHTDEIVARLLEKSPLVPLLIEESVRRGTHVLVELPSYLLRSRSVVVLMCWWNCLTGCLLSRLRNSCRRLRDSHPMLP